MPPFRLPRPTSLDYEHDPDYRAARALARKVLAPVLFMFGLVLFNPWVNTFDTAAAWGLMRSLTFGYEWPWGLAFMSIGTAHFYAFTRHRGEVYTCAATLGTYAFIALLFLPYGYTSTGPYIYGVLTIATYFELQYVFNAFVRSRQ